MRAVPSYGPKGLVYSNKIAINAIFVETFAPILLNVLNNHNGFQHKSENSFNADDRKKNNKNRCKAVAG